MTLTLTTSDAQHAGDFLTIDTLNGEPRTYRMRPVSDTSCTLEPGMLIEIYRDVCVLRRSEPYTLPGGYELIVPEGFRTDLASVPRWLRSFFPFASAWQRAAVLHDYLYDEPTLALTRKTADRYFRVTMAGDRVGVATRWAMWAAVRAFGWIYWKERQVPPGACPLRGVHL